MLLLPLIAVLAVAAASPTPTIMLSPTPTPNDILKQVEQKVQANIQQILHPAVSAKQGLIGKIITLDGSSFSLSYQNDTKTIQFDATTTVINTSHNKTKTSALTVGQDVTVLCDYDSSANIYTAKRILFTPLSGITNTHLVMIGTVSDISKSTSSPVLTITSSQDKNPYQIKTDAKTSVITENEDKIAFSGITKGQKIIAVLIPDPKISKTYYAQKLIDLDYAPSPTPTPKTP